MARQHSLIAQVFLLLSLFSAVHASTVLGQYFSPLYTSQTGSGLATWSQTDLVFWKEITTTKSGLASVTEASRSNAKAFMKNAHKHSAKALFSVGGFEGGRYFSNLMASAGNRAAFAKKIESMRKHLGGYDGVLLDWDAPGVDTTGCNTVRQTDAAHLKLFLTQLRAALGADKLIAVAVAPTGLVGEAEKVLSNGLSSFFNKADYVIINTADVTGSWSSKTGPGAPLRTCGSESSFTSAAEFYVKAGLPKRKLLLTVPADAVSFTTSSTTLKKTTYGGYSSQVYQSKSDVVPQGDVNDKGLSFTNVCGDKSSGYSGIYGGLSELVKERLVSSSGNKGAGGFGYHWDSCTETPFLFRPSTKHLISFENARSVEAKAKYVADHGLGGLVISDTSGLPTALYKDIAAGINNTKLA